MHKTKRKGHPRRRAFLLSAILFAALIPIFLGVAILLQMDFERQQEEAWKLTQAYYLCVPTQVMPVYLPDVVEVVQSALEDAAITYDNVGANAMMDFCTTPNLQRPGILSIRIPRAANAAEDDAALGEKIADILRALTTIPPEQLTQIRRIVLYDVDRHLNWGMDLEDALYWLGEDVDPYDLYEEGRIP